MIHLNDVFVNVTDDWVSRVILDEVVVMPLCKSEEDMHYIYSIPNAIGTRIWQLLDGEHSVRDIQEVLKYEYRGQAEVIERDVLEFLGDLSGAELIRKSRQKKSSKSSSAAVNTKQPQNKKKPYQSPEIAKVKMQPEQAVLACCSSGTNPKATTQQTMACGCARTNCNTSTNLVTSSEVRT